MQQLRQKGGQVGLLDASTKETLGGSETADFVGQYVHQVGLRIRSAVGEGAFDMVPYAFVGIQFGGVRREGHQMQAGGAREKLLHRVTAMDVSIIQQNDEMAAHLAQQMAKEEGHFLALDVVLIELTVERAVKSLRTDGDTGDGGDAVMAIVVRQDGGLSHRTPCSTDGGNQEEAGFIDKDYVGRQSRRVFFTAGHTSRFHASMAPSSRSIARPSGFWGLQCNWCRSLPT